MKTTPKKLTLSKETVRMLVKTSVTAGWYTQTRVAGGCNVTDASCAASLCRGC
jgi:hypothetical protein